MTTTINNKHKKLNVPNKREQNQTCLDSAEREGLRPKGNVPNLRFPEFQREWEKCTLNEVCKFHNGRAYKQTELLAAGKYRVLRVGNFFTNDSWYYSNLELEDNKYAQNGDLLYAWSASFGPRFWREEKVIFHYHIWKIDSFKNVDKNFLYHFLDLDSAKIKNEVQGGTMVHITKGDMEKRTISYPSVPEQRNIARFLFLLDERIATQNKIIEDLKMLKSAISKLLFTRKDLLETTIRLADIATLKNGYAFQSSKYNILGKWKIITIANVSGGRYINEEDCNCIINLPNDIQDHQVLKEGDILISLTGNVGRVSLCKSGAYLLNQRVGLLQIEGNIDKEFLYQVLSSRRFENSMIACGQGAAQMNIGKGDVENFVLPYSSNANNIHLVARILHSYDECIINELRELTLLTMQKQYFLVQMFI